ncbi:hypothetical protein VTK56DRAFT_2394 [Thermocarpiscus australiensis]
MLTVDDTEPFKKDFLDRLAEMLCREKDPSFIACAAMIEREDEITIVAARNGGSWAVQDVRLLEELATIVERISLDDVFDESPIPSLQRRLTEYYTPRLRHHVQELLKHEAGKTNMDFFSNFCRDFLSGKVSAHDLVECVATLSDSTDFYATLKATFPSARLRRLVEDLAFIERPLTSARAFCYAARQIAGCGKIAIQLLPRFPWKPRSVPPVSLPKAEFPMCREFRKKFAAELAKVKWIHAEIRVMTHLLSQGIPAGTVPYLGVSKKTCFLCGHIIQAMGQFQTRGNHGKVYSQWTLPSALPVEPRDARRLQAAVQHVQEILKSEAVRDDLRPTHAEKESVMAAPVVSRTAKSTPFRHHVPDPRRQQRESEWLGSFSRRGQSSEDVDSDRSPHLGTELDSIDVEEHTISRPAEPEAAPKRCARCKVQLDLLTPCPKCRQAAYCGGECRDAHWPTHKFACQLGRSLDAADYLVLACQRNRFPGDDEDTATAYGLRYFASAKDRLRLFRLYGRLVNEAGVGDEELREAWQKDRLREFLLFRCSQIQAQRADVLRDMEWLREQHGFRANAVCQNFAQATMDQARSFLVPEDRDVPFAKLMPLQKRQACVFYGQILSGYVPAVDEDNWISLGFCIAPNGQGVTQLADAYSVLVRRCQFEEFWRAMTNSTMTKLFDKYGMGREVAVLRNFKNFMGIVAKWHQSVWELKRFTLTADSRPIRAVEVDYGFMNCQTPRERTLLREMYRDYFAKGEDEMKLHQACIKGELPAFLESTLGKLSVPREVLSNEYPLDGCSYVGMVADSVLLCPESLEEETRLIHQRDGGQGVILTIPDAHDEAMRRHLEDRAGILDVGSRKRITRHRGRYIASFSGE